MTEEDARFRAYLEENGHDTAFMGVKDNHDSMARLETAPPLEQNNDVGKSKLDQE